MKVLDSCTVHTVHSAQLVFSKWADPNSWPDWDAQVREVRFEEQAKLGARGRLYPVSGPAMNFSVVEFEPEKVFTNNSLLLGAKLFFEHRVSPKASGSVVEVTVGVEGLLAPLWKRILSKNLGSAARSSVSDLLKYLDGV